MIDIRLSDNLELMAEMKDNSVDLIYCDILYGTGKDFMDYKDLYPMREIIEEHYKPRIKEMYRILKDTGGIYLQMDYKINHWVRCIVDDVFGYDNFRNEIVWTYGGWAKHSNKEFSKKHDNIIFYSKTGKHKINKITEEWKKEDYIKTRKQKLYIDENNKEYVFADGRKTVKRYIEEVIKDGKLINDIWNIKPLTTSSKERLGYATQKPKALIERIIKASSNEGDLVADFYAGSFTTAEVCKDLGRNFIGCDISEKAVAIGLERTKY